MKNEGRLHIEMAHSSNLWTRLLYYLSSIMHVLLTVFFGYLVSARPTINPLVFVFAGASKLFAVLFAEGRNASKKTRIYSTIALASSIPLLMGLSSSVILTGVLILLLYSLYPLCNGRAPFDVIHHSLRYVFIFILGYGSLAFYSGTALLALLAIALFSVVGELLAGLGKRREFSKSAASLLGIKRSLTTVISLIFIASFIVSFVLNNMFEFPIQINETFIPFYIVPALTLDLFLTTPLMKALNEKHVDAFHIIRKKEVTVIIIMSLLFLVVFQTARISTIVAVGSRDYSFDVSIRTIIAGMNSWDVPWIVFDYINENNYCYVVFHKDGILELSQKIDGQVRYYESSLKTQLTPFQWHNFHIVLNETTVAVRLDGEYQVTTSRQLVADNCSIIISPSTPSPTGIWIACIYSIDINP